MKRTEAIEWLKNIKEKYIHGGDDFYDYQRRTAIDYAISVLENIQQKPTTKADRIRAMTDEELANYLNDTGWGCYLCAETRRLASEPLLRNETCDGKCVQHCLEWLQQPAEVEHD